MNVPNNQKEQLLKSLFKEVELQDELSITEKVMQQVQELPTQKTIEYEPPISSSAWMVIASLVGVLLVISLLMDTSFATNIPAYLSNISGWMDRLTNRIDLHLRLPVLPTISGHYLTVILAFNVVGIYFIFSYWKTRRI